MERAAPECVGAVKHIWGQRERATGKRYDLKGACRGKARSKGTSEEVPDYPRAEKSGPRQSGSQDGFCKDRSHMWGTSRAGM